MLARGLILGLCISLSACAPSPEAPNAPVRVVGSSTVYPFAVRAAERVEDPSITFVIEQTGSGGGHKIFCAADSQAHLVMSSRRRLLVEAEDCLNNGRPDTVEIALGYDGIVLAKALTNDQNPERPNPAFPSLSRRVLWQALVADLPIGPDCRFVSNPHKLWSELDPSLPETAIAVEGPPPTSGTRDGFVALVMEAGALSDPCMQRLYAEDMEAFRQRAGRLREDGAWTDAGENDASLIQNLRTKPDVLGVLGQSSAVRYGEDLQLIAIEDVTPTPINLKTRTYPLLRPLFLYIDKSATRPTQELVEAMTSEEALGDNGYLTQAGLIALPLEERQAEREKIDPLLYGGDDRS